MIHLILDNIKSLCREHDTNISAVERDVGLGLGTIYKWSKVSPSVDNAKAVADHFGVTLDDLMRNDPDDPPREQDQDP